MGRLTLIAVALGLVLSTKSCWSDAKEVIGIGNPRWWSKFDTVDLAVMLLLVLVAAVVVGRRYVTERR